MCNDFLDCIKSFLILCCYEWHHFLLEWHYIRKQQLSQQKRKREAQAHEERYKIHLTKANHLKEGAL